MKKFPTRCIIAVFITVLAGVGMFFGFRAGILNKYRNMSLELPDGFTVTAHTGCMETEENSFESIKAGAESGADIVEFDVRFLSDGTPVLAHNEPEGNEITLEEAFAYFSQFNGIKANVDIKETANLAEIQNLAEMYGIADRIFLTGVNEDFVEAVRNQCPQISYYLNVDVEKNKAKDIEYINGLVDKVKNSGAVGINCNFKNVSAELVSAFHENGFSVSLWTVDKEFDMQKVLNLSPDNITTRNPKKLNEIISQRQKNS